MKILTVIPIAKGIPRDELSYFSAKPVTLGTIVSVPFGNRSTKGVVISQDEVRELKGSIKSSSFALRNVAEVHPETLPFAIFSAAQKTASFYAQPVGPVLKTMVPDQVFDAYLSQKAPVIKQTLHNPDVQAIQVPLSERISYYRTLVRENLAKKTSTMIIAPSVGQAEHIAKSLKIGIEEFLVIAHSRVTKKSLSSLIQKVFEKDPVVLVATAPYSSLIRADWETIVIEESSSQHYRYGFGPIFDMRTFVAELAALLGARLLYADTLLGSDIRAGIKERKIIEARSTWHIAKPKEFEIIDMKTQTLTPDPSPRGRGEKLPFSMLHQKTLDLVQTAAATKSPSVLLTTRKGLAPLTACSDCGTSVTCPVCETPLVLHRTTANGNGEARTYLCHHCMNTTRPIDSCLNCGSWKLKPLGISTDGIRAELEEKLPAVRSYLLDGDIAATPSAIAKTISAWAKDEGSVLIATPMAIPFLKDVSYGAIVSMDSLLSLPSYSSGERSLHTALSFLERITEKGLIQTRNRQHDVIAAIAQENTFDYMRGELESRTLFGYPPAKVLAKISLDVRKDDAKEASEYLEIVLKDGDPDLLLKRAKESGLITVQAVLKVETRDWNDPDCPLRIAIGTLGREWKKEVNPDSAL